MSHDHHSHRRRRPRPAPGTGAGTCPGDVPLAALSLSRAVTAAFPLKTQEYSTRSRWWVFSHAWMSIGSCNVQVILSKLIETGASKILSLVLQADPTLKLLNGQPLLQNHPRTIHKCNFSRLPRLMGSH